MDRPAMQDHINAICVKAGSASAVCGGTLAVVSNDLFWAIFVGAAGAAAAWWGAVRRDRRESALLRIARDEHAARLRLIEAQTEFRRRRLDGERTNP